MNEIFEATKRRCIGEQNEVESFHYRAGIEQPLKWTPETARQRVGGTFGT